jgi:hypothetical protein
VISGRTNDTAVPLSRCYGVSYKKQELFTVHAGVFGGIRVAYLFSCMCCPIMCLCVPCCDVRYDFIRCYGVMSNCTDVT